MKNKRSSTAKMQIACAIIFITFTYVYLAFYQADVLAVAQHVFSGGLTNYSYTLAPLLITLVLYLLQVGVYAVTRVKRRFHGLTYFPLIHYADGRRFKGAYQIGRASCRERV